MTKIAFPNESAAYRTARDELLAAEIALRNQMAKVTALRAQLPLGGELKEDYVFDSANGQVKLSDLFGAKETLFLYGFMFAPDAENPCPGCSSLLDALNGNARHLGERIAMAVSARAPIERLCTYADKRGWDNLQLVSSANNTYQRDYLAENDNGQMPMANVFVKRNGVIRHFWGSEMLYASFDGSDPRHMDLMWPLWNVLDTTPSGRGDWYPPLWVK